MIWVDLEEMNRSAHSVTVNSRGPRIKPCEYWWQKTRHKVLILMTQERVYHYFSNMGVAILGDPGAVSRVGRKGGKKVFKYERKSLWVPTLTELFPKIQADTGSWLGTKNALYYCAQLANSFSWVLFVSSFTTAIVLPHLPGSKYCLPKS